MDTKKKIVILQGHPDSAKNHLCHALASAYEAGARDAGHEVTTVAVTDLDFPMLRSPDDWNNGQTPDGLLDVQATLLAADHLMVIFPLWLGSLPALLKGFFEQIFRPTLIPEGDELAAWRSLLKGRSVRVVVTMGMPALAYRLFFLSHGVKFFTRNVLAFSGCGPIRTSYFGMVDRANDTKKQRWFGKMRRFGASAK